MASEVRKIVVEITNNDGGGNGQTTTINETNNTEVNITALLHPIKNIGNNALGKSVLVNQAYGIAKQTITQAVNLTMNRYFNMSENYIGQSNLNNFMTGVNKIRSLGASVITGAMVGAKGGFVGASVGALVGAVGFGASEFLSYQGRMSGYYASLNASNYQTQFGRTRAGLTNGSKGTEN